MIILKNDFISIGQVIREHPNEEIVIEIQNTKGQSADKLRKIAQMYPQVKISVLGGLDYTKKRKFNDSEYKGRTIYTPMELSTIIKIYESIERGIDIDWTETQKAMYGYKRLCDYMDYSENIVNGKDYARGIGGVIYRKAVCSGFAMIYKEFLDRQGIENYYQNKRGHHSWNIAKLDGEYRALELTWDCYQRPKEGCAFFYFNREQNFYNNPHHNIDKEVEERKFPIVPFSIEELRQNLLVITRPKVVELDVSQIGNTEISTNFNIKRGEQVYQVHTEQTKGVISLVTNDEKQNYKCFIRNDGTSFCLMKADNNVKGLNKFIILEHKKRKLTASYIFSEKPLVDMSTQYDDVIANGLLNSSRVRRKIEQFNGYVGYFGIDKNIYYNSNVEKNLNIIDR